MRSVNESDQTINRFDAEPLGSSQFDEVIDEFIDLYVYWREQCVAVRATYRRWCNVPAAERDDAFAAYCAALDREQLAADRYQEIAQEVAATLAIGSPVEAIRAGLGS